MSVNVKLNSIELKIDAPKKQKQRRAKSSLTLGSYFFRYLLYLPGERRKEHTQFLEGNQEESTLCFFFF